MDFKELFRPIFLYTEAWAEQESKNLQAKEALASLSDRLSKLEDEMMPEDEWDENHP